MKSLRLRTLTAHASKVTPREHFLHELGLLSRITRALLCGVGLVCTVAPQAQAQNSGGQPSGGYWQFTLTVTGAFDGSLSYPGITQAQTWHDAITGGGGSMSGNGKANFYTYQGFTISPFYSYINQAQAAVHFKAVWTQNNYGYPTTPTPAPAKLTVCYTNGASWSAGSNSSSLDITLYEHKAANGWNDAEVLSGTYNGNSSGGI